MNEPLDTTLIEARIKSQVSVLQSVEGAADYAAVEKLNSFRTPCAYVVLDHEDGSTNLAPGSHQASAVFGVIVAVRNYRDNRGAAAKQGLRGVVGEIRTCLVGWRPEGREFHACSWVSGRVLDYDQATLLWLEVFKTNYFVNGDM